MQTLEQKLILEKPKLLGKTKDFLKNKWVKYVGGAIVAGSLMLGGAARLQGQEQIINNDQQQEPVTQQVVQDNKYKAIGYVYEGDYDKNPNLDFIFEDLEKSSKDGQPLRIMVHEDYDTSNADMLSKIILRVNNPQQYPWLEVTGKLWPASPYANMGRLDLESIIFKDQQGKEEVFFPKPSSSSFYAEDEQQTMDWVYAPGRNLVSVYYPSLYNIRPSWDWDMDGLPNWIDPFPFAWNTLDPFIFDIGFGIGHWRDPAWFGWNFWSYWGDPDYYRNHHYDDWSDVKRIINRDQLKDPHNREIIQNYAERMHESRDLNRVFTPEKIKQIQGDRQVLLDRQYQLARENPVASIRQKDGTVVRAQISEPLFRAPDRTITLDHFRAPSYTNPGQHEVTKGSQTQNAPASKGTGSTVTKAPQKSSPPASSKGNAGNTKGSSGSNKGSSGKASSSTVKKKHEEGNSSYSISQPNQPSRPYAPTSQSQTYGPRTTSTIKVYPSQIQPRIIRPSQQQVQQYSSPRINDYNSLKGPVKSPSPSYVRPNLSSGIRNTAPRSTYSSPRTYSTPKYSAPKYSGKSSGSYKAPSYRSSGSSTRSSSSHSSGSVRKK